MTLAAGTRLGPYEIVAPIGAGGMGEVYRARDTRLGRDVALKLLPAGLLPDPEAQRRFASEARTVSALNQPNIVTIFDVSLDGSDHFIAMELIQGETLRDLIAPGKIEIRRALELAAQAASGLAAAHEAGVIHRDIKPENLMVNRAGQLKILDFGLAKLDEKKRASFLSSGDLTATGTPSGERAATARGTIVGTVSYMSPEQASGRPLDGRTDIFSLGLVLYELLTGQRAFSGDSVIEVLHAIINDDPRPASEWNPRLPQPMTEILAKATAKDPAERYRHAGDMELDLRRVKRAIESGGASGAVAPSKSGKVRGPVLRWIAAGFLALASALVGLWIGRSRGEPSDGSRFAEGSLTHLTTDPGYEGEPTFSPDGQTIAYVADRDGNFEIYLQQISGGPALNLTRNPAQDIQPAFSPDGREIAFVSNRSSKSDIFHAGPNLPLVGGDIWVMPALGGSARRIVENGNCPSWTPDGSGLLYVHGTFRDTRIARVSATGGESRDIHIDEPFISRYFFPSLSEDGRWVLYQNGGQVEVAPAGGGAPRLLARGEYPSWGPGSASVLFTSGMPGKNRTLWKAPFSLVRGEFAGAPRPLTFGRGADLGARSSRDGTAIAFAAVDESLNLESVNFDAEAGTKSNPPMELTAGDNRIGDFDPAPDGRAVVFTAERGASSHVWRIDPPAAPIQLTVDPAYSDNQPEWSPNGLEIAFTRRTSQSPEAETSVWIMKADGTSPRRVTGKSARMAWLPDSSKILIQDDKGLALVDLASGATTLVRGANSRTLFAVDATGEWIAYQTSERGALTVAAVPTAGGTPREVVTATLEAYHPFFSPSGNWLYFQPDHKNLFRVPGPKAGWALAPPQQVTNFSGFDLYLDFPKISRDGRKLFYTRGRRTGDIFILRQDASFAKRPL
ncbi:MAG: protein kinase [Acidobacteriota bacterium]|nr:protein kinase [Acidobacteriota bacterium]